MLWPIESVGWELPSVDYAFITACRMHFMQQILGGFCLHSTFAAEAPQPICHNLFECLNAKQLLMLIFFLVKFIIRHHNGQRNKQPRFCMPSIHHLYYMFIFLVYLQTNADFQFLKLMCAERVRCACTTWKYTLWICSMSWNFFHSLLFSCLLLVDVVARLCMFGGSAWPVAAWSTTCVHRLRLPSVAQCAIQCVGIRTGRHKQKPEWISYNRGHTRACNVLLNFFFSRSFLFIYFFVFIFIVRQRYI